MLGFNYRVLCRNGSKYSRDAADLLAANVMRSMIVVGTIIEDIITLGGGILDDPASFAVVWALVRVAQTAP